MLGVGFTMETHIRVDRAYKMNQNHQNTIQGKQKVE